MIFDSNEKLIDTILVDKKDTLIKKNKKNTYIAIKIYNGNEYKYSKVQKMIFNSNNLKFGYKITDVTYK